MLRPWAFWRRVQYTTGFFVLVSLISTVIYYVYIYKAPTCFDSIQNADERGVDCGGVCARICSFDILPPESVWAQSFKIVDGQYNVVAYIENRNEEVGTADLRYTMRLYDKKGLITERSGTTVFPPDGVYPIFEDRVMTGDRFPTKTTIEFDEGIVWLPAPVGREQFVLEGRNLKNVDSKPRLTAQIRNTSLVETKDVEVVATIFDAAGNPLTASRTVVEYFGGRETRDIVFTWPEPIAKTLRSCEVPTDVVMAIDLSGSMNDDGGTPPEPVTSVLAAAKAFVSQLHDADQISLVTYATAASVVEELTSDNERVMSVIEKLGIDSKEERGNTNTGEGIKRITEELTTNRHSEDARKVAIILTDGLATAPRENPEQYAEEAAVALKALDVQIFTIGLGAKVNETFLTTIATDKAHYYKAPTVNELDSIYTKITESICEDGPAVIEIIAKPETSFATGS